MDDRKTRGGNLTGAIGFVLRRCSGRWSKLAAGNLNQLGQDISKR